MRLSTLMAGLAATVVRDGDVTAFGSLKAAAEGTLHYYSDAGFAGQFRKLGGWRSVIAMPELADQVPDGFGLAVAEKPREAFLLAYLQHGRALAGSPPFPTEIAPSAQVHPRASIAEQSVRIGAGVVIDANAVIMERVEIEDGVHIGPGCVVGEAGLEVAMVEGRQILVPHFGGVLIRSGVTLLANATVACSLYGGRTVIGRDTVIDNLVYVAHDVVIGERCQVMASAVLSGSCVLGDDVRIGPRATISNALRIGDRARVTLGSVVAENVPADGHVTGHFAVPHRRFLDRVLAQR